jgi:hypothetical protein
LDTPAATRETEAVAQADRVQHGLEFVKSVGAFAEDVQQQVDFAGRFFFQRHGHKKSANTGMLARGAGGAPCQIST